MKRVLFAMMVVALLLTMALPIFANSTPDPIQKFEQYMKGGRQGPLYSPDGPQIGTPSLKDIKNDDEDGNYIVSWSPVGGVLFYSLQERKNSGDWNSETTVNNVVSKRGQADGFWCYRVKAVDYGGGSSGYSAVKCTTVDTTPEPPSEELLYLPMIRR